MSGEGVITHRVFFLKISICLAVRIGKGRACRFLALAAESPPGAPAPRRPCDRGPRHCHRHRYCLAAPFCHTAFASSLLRAVLGPKEIHENARKRPFESHLLKPHSKTGADMSGMPGFRVQPEGATAPERGADMSDWCGQSGHSLCAVSVHGVVAAHIQADPAAINGFQAVVVLWMGRPSVVPFVTAMCQHIQQFYMTDAALTHVRCNASLDLTAA